MADDLKDIKNILDSLVGKGTLSNYRKKIFKDAMDELKQIDTILTQTAKANAALSKADLAKLGNEAFDIAGKYGKTAVDYLSSVQSMYKFGYKNASALAELSVAIQSAGGLTAELANQYIITADKAYNLGGNIEKLTGILDGNSRISGKYGISMEELAKCFTLAGSQASLMGLEADKTASALATLMASTGQNGTEAAKSLEHILFNLRDITEAGQDACAAMERLDTLSAELGKTNSLKLTGDSAGNETQKMYADMIQEYANGTDTVASKAGISAPTTEKDGSSLPQLLNTIRSLTDKTKSVYNFLQKIKNGFDLKNPGRGKLRFLSLLNMPGMACFLMQSISFTCHPSRNT